MKNCNEKVQTHQAKYLDILFFKVKTGIDKDYSSQAVHKVEQELHFVIGFHVLV